MDYDTKRTVYQELQKGLAFDMKNFLPNYHPLAKETPDWDLILSLMPDDVSPYFVKVVNAFKDGIIKKNKASARFFLERYINNMHGCIYTDCDCEGEPYPGYDPVMDYKMYVVQE